MIFIIVFLASNMQKVVFGIVIYSNLKINNWFQSSPIAASSFFFFSSFFSFLFPISRIIYGPSKLLNWQSNYSIGVPLLFENLKSGHLYMIILTVETYKIHFVSMLDTDSAR